jgi:hypothetical protein
MNDNLKYICHGCLSKIEPYNYSEMRTVCKNQTCILFDLSLYIDKWINNKVGICGRKKFKNN